MYTHGVRERAGEQIIVLRRQLGKNLGKSKLLRS